MPAPAEDSDNERYNSDSASKRRKVTRKIDRSTGFQAAFQCMYKHDGEGEHQNPNERTIQVVGTSLRVKNTLRLTFKCSYQKCRSTMR